MNNKEHDENRDRYMYGDDDQNAESSPILIGKKKRGFDKTVGLVLAAVCLILLLVIIMLINKGYVIKNTVIQGESPYNAESIKAIIDKYCDEKGTRSYFYIRTEEICEKIKSELPYVKSVSIEKKAPDTLIVSLEGESAEAFIKYLDKYYLLSAEMKVLDRTELEPIRPRLIELDIDLPSVIEIGKLLVFPEEGSMDAETYSRIYSALIDSGVREKVESLDIKNKFDLKMKLYGGVDVKIGSVKDIEEKLTTLSNWLSDNTSEVSSTLNLDISILKKVFVSYD